MSTATETWQGLSLPWQVAFEEAWASFRSGNFGVGAVLTEPPMDGEPGAIVTAGRNRVAQQQRSPRTLSGNMVAHAEMNAFAELDTVNAEGLHLFTTLEPCLMSAATAIQLKVKHVHYAAANELLAEMDELWTKFPFTAERQPSSSGPIGGPLAGFARLLPMTFTLEQQPRGSAEQTAREAHPGLAALIEDLSGDAAWLEIRSSGTCHRALGHLWQRLCAAVD